MTSDRDIPQRPAPTLPPAGNGVARMSSDALLRGARELEIEHRGVLYRLRCTSQGKLILTK